MLLKGILIVLIGSLIGWVTNFFAIKMLFRPHREVNILGFKIQGLIPKRRTEIAESIAETIDEELISMKDITATLDSIEIEDEIDKMVDVVVDTKLKKEIIAKFPMAGMFLNGSLMDKIKAIVKEAIEENKNEFVEIVINKLEENVDIKKMVVDKMEGFSLDYLEEMTFKIAKNELRHIEVVGAVLGAIIGAVQFGVSYFL
ncbi:DUF445 family protein [uncultured Ilyobacter sp.]|uniref:DUF445 domain-containing protein n=1 Tax=uncultured Ilyobacter sp. TaxID=544433 RepID=UPI0029F59DD0|nr:DUF445 family protein [uncultured Ilyobacter sp.]